MNGQNYYAPVPFDPNSLYQTPPPPPNTPGQNYGYNPTPPSLQTGYINFGSDYNPDTNPNAYAFSPYFQLPKGPISYGTAPSKYQLSGNQGDPLINGIDYTQGMSYANLAAMGIGTPKQGASGVDPYTPTTEPGYKAPQYSQPSAPQTQDKFSAPTQFLFGNNGSAGVLNGVFSNNTPGEYSNFYQSGPMTQPGSLSKGVANTMPVNPSLQALTMSRSQ